MPQPHDPSVFNEPHMRPTYPVSPGVVPYASPNTPQPTEHDPQQDIHNEPLYVPPTVPTIDNTVWDEPGLARELTGAAPADQPTYARWLEHHRANWTLAQSWFITITLALIAGPFAIAGALWGSGQSIFSILMLTIIGPLTEEMMKIAAPTLAVESRPYFFRSGLQIILCGICGGLAFAAIENLVYLFIYIKDPTPTIIAWRWTVCVALHTCCSAIASVGLRRTWSESIRAGTRPKLSRAFPALILATVVHGLYNTAALLMETADFF